MDKKIIALVPAAGVGLRFGELLPKQYLDLNGRPMIYHALAALAAVPRISRIHVILAPDDHYWPRYDWPSWDGRLTTLHCGGKTRGESVLNGLTSFGGEVEENNWVLVHDAARPCIRPDLIERLIDTLADDPVGGLLALPMSDTVKLANELQRVDHTVTREKLWRAQTPQMFRYGLLKSALNRYLEVTDESQAIEILGGYTPQLVEGDSTNLKVTYAADMKIAGFLLRELEKGSPA